MFRRLGAPIDRRRRERAAAGERVVGVRAIALTKAATPRSRVGISGLPRRPPKFGLGRIHTPIFGWVHVVRTARIGVGWATLVIECVPLWIRSSYPSRRRRQERGCLQIERWPPNFLFLSDWSRQIINWTTRGFTFFHTFRNPSTTHRHGRGGQAGLEPLRVGRRDASPVSPAAARRRATTTMRDRGSHGGGLGGPGGLLLSRRALQVYAFLFVNTLIFVMRSQWM